MHKRNSITGVTLLELLIVAAIMAILGVAGFAYLGSYWKNINIEKDVNQIINYLELARSRSISRENDKNWGVHFENPSSGTDFFEIYSTSSDYASGTVSEKIYLSSGVIFSDPSAGNSKDIQFIKSSGKISSNSAVNISSSNGANIQYYITVIKGGSIIKTASSLKDLGESCSNNNDCLSGYCTSSQCDEGGLSCIVTDQACTDTTVLKISSAANGHAELPDQTNFDYYVCCSPDSLGTSCSGNYDTILKLYASANAHVEKSTESNFSTAACLSKSTGAIDCDYAENCSSLGASYVCLVSISGDTNAHIGDCDAFSTKVCCKI